MVGGVTADGNEGWDEDARTLYGRFLAGTISSDQMVAEFPQVWRHRSRRDPLDSPDAWRAMVDHIGGYFTWSPGQADGRRASRPWRSRWLYRGATASRRFGMSWTRSLGVAEDFARNRQPYGDERGQVWLGLFAPSRLLGFLEDEREYLVDTAEMDIRLWSPGEIGWLSRLRRGI
jgi:hypothetical protein